MSLLARSHSVDRLLSDLWCLVRDHSVSVRVSILSNGHDLTIYLRQRDLSLDKLPPLEISCQHTIDPRYTAVCVRYIDSCMNERACLLSGEDVHRIVRRQHAGTRRHLRIREVSTSFNLWPPNIIVYSVNRFPRRRYHLLDLFYPINRPEKIKNICNPLNYIMVLLFIGRSSSTSFNSGALI